MKHLCRHGLHLTPCQRCRDDAAATLRDVHETQKHLDTVLQRLTTAHEDALHIRAQRAALAATPSITVTTDYERIRIGLTHDTDAAWADGDSIAQDTAKRAPKALKSWLGTVFVDRDTGDTTQTAGD